MRSRAMNEDNLRRQLEERSRGKKQGYRRTKQGLDGNQTKMGRSKVTNIEYNTVAPLKCFL